MRPATKVTTLGLLCLLGLVFSAPLTSQQSAAKPASSEIQPWSEPAGTTGIKVITVPKPGDDQAEFAILRLTVEKYNEFQKNPKEFLNKLKLFKYDIKDLTDCPAEKPLKPPDGDAFWFIVIPHWPGSKAVCQGYSDWDKPKH